MSKGNYDQNSNTYFETIVVTAPVDEAASFSISVISGSKTVTYKNASNVAMWNGSSAICTGVSGSTASHVSNWKVSNLKTSCSGNLATASATGKRYLGNIVVETVNRTAVFRSNGSGTLY